MPKFAPMYCAKNLPDLISPPQASNEFLTHCIFPNQHMEANRSATDAKTDVASVPGGWEDLSGELECTAHV